MSQEVLAHDGSCAPYFSGQPRRLTEEDMPLVPVPGAGTVGCANRYEERKETLARHQQRATIMRTMAASWGFQAVAHLRPSHFFVGQCEDLASDLTLTLSEIEMALDGTKHLHEIEGQMRRLEKRMVAASFAKKGVLDVVPCASAGSSVDQIDEVACAPVDPDIVEICDGGEEADAEDDSEAHEGLDSGGEEAEKVTCEQILNDDTDMDKLLGDAFGIAAVGPKGTCGSSDDEPLLKRRRRMRTKKAGSAASHRPAVRQAPQPLSKQSNGQCRGKGNTFDQGKGSGTTFKKVKGKWVAVE